MKRTKDGGAILYHNDGTKTRLNSKEFYRMRSVRDIIRISIIGLVAGISLIFNLSPDFTIGFLLIAIGWRLKTGW